MPEAKPVAGRSLCCLEQGVSQPHQLFFVEWVCGGRCVLIIAIVDGINSTQDTWRLEADTAKWKYYWNIFTALLRRGSKCGTHWHCTAHTGEERNIDFNLLEKVFVELTANIPTETWRSKPSNLPQPQEQVSRINAWHGMQHLYFMTALLEKSPYRSLSLGKQGKEYSRIWDV